MFADSADKLQEKLLSDNGSTRVATKNFGCDQDFSLDYPQGKLNSWYMANDLTSIRSRVAVLAKLRKEIDDEVSELETAERVLLRLAAMPSDGQHHADLPRGRVTHRELVLSVLRAAPDTWLESRDVRAEIKRAHGVDIQPTSLQPLLSGLKDKGTIVRDGRRIALAERVRSGGNDRGPASTGPRN